MRVAIDKTEVLVRECKFILRSDLFAGCPAAYLKFQCEATDVFSWNDIDRRPIRTMVDASDISAVVSQFLSKECDYRDSIQEPHESELESQLQTVVLRLDQLPKDVLVDLEN